MNKYYYLDGVGNVKGPLSLVELDVLNKRGGIASSTKVCAEGTENWILFCQVPRPAAQMPKPNKATETVKKSKLAQKKVEHVGITKFQGTCIIFFLFIGFGLPVGHLLKPIPKWEYTIISPTDLQFEIKMDEAGEEGWELVFARRASSGESEFCYECIMKRPKK